MSIQNPDNQNKLRSIPFSPPDISELEIVEVAEVICSGLITTGPKQKNRI